MKDSVYVIAINTQEAIPLSWEVFLDKRQAIELNTQCISVVAYMMLVLDVLIICLSSQVFDRESILTLWR
jgi:hypothetical protein